MCPPSPLSHCPCSCLFSSSKQAAQQISSATVLAATLNWLKRCRRRRRRRAVGRVSAIRRAYKLHPAGRTLATPRLPDWTLTNACIYFLLCSSRGRGRARSSSIHHRHRHRHLLLLLLLQAAPRCSNNSW